MLGCVNGHHHYFAQTRILLSWIELLWCDNFLEIDGIVWFVDVTNYIHFVEAREGLHCRLCAEKLKFLSLPLTPR